MTVASTESQLLDAPIAIGVLNAVHATTKEIVETQQALTVKKEEIADQVKQAGLAKLEADMALYHVPLGSDLDRRIRYAIDGLMASIGKGDFASSLATLKAAVAEAQRAAPEVEQRKNTHHYHDVLASVELSDHAKEQVRIRSQVITDENLPDYVKSYVNEFEHFSPEERAESARFMENMLRNTDEGKAHVKAMSLVPQKVLEETATQQLKGKQLLESMLKDAEYAQYKLQIRQMIDRGYYNLPESETVIMQIHMRVEVQAVWQGMGQLRELQGKDIQAFGNALTHDLSSREKDLLRSIGGEPIDGADVLDVYFAAGPKGRNAARADVTENGLEGASIENQKIYASIVYARRSLPAASMAATRRWAEQIVKERGLSEHKEQDKYLLKIGEIVESHDLSLNEKVDQAYEMVKDSDDFKRLPKNEAKALIKASITQIEKHGGLEAFSKLSEAKIKESERDFMKSYNEFSKQMSEGIDAMLSGDAKGTAEAAKGAGEQAGEIARAQGATQEQAENIQAATETVLSGVGSVVVTVTQIFTTTTQFSDAIDQELAGLDLSELKAAQREAITGADGKIDVAKLRASLGSSLASVDANQDGIVNGVEALQALKNTETGRTA